LPEGIVLKGIGGFYYIKSPIGLIACTPRGIFRKDDIILLPGDKVRYSIADEEKLTGVLEEILPRQSELIRPAVANVSQIAVVIAVKSPAPDVLLLEKLLITARHKNIKPVIIVNKIDQDTSDGCKELERVYGGAVFKLLFLSAKGNIGIDQLHDLLKGEITVFAGQSGVGKSTILNCIAGYSRMETGEMSNRIERGKHTTRQTELIELENGGYIADTPGFSTFELTGLELEELELYYPEFEQYLNSCRFNRCSHINEPDCVIKEAVKNGEIQNERYERYIHFYNILKKQKDNRYKK